MREVINFGFNGGLKFYIGTTKYWLGTVGGTYKITHDKTSLKLTIIFFWVNVFSVLGSLLLFGH